MFYVSCYPPTPNLTNVVSLSRCGATCFPRGVADWQKQSADSIYFYFVVRAIRISFSFNLSDEVQLGVLALQKLYPFDFRVFGSSAQGDCSWEVRALFRTFRFILLLMLSG